MLSLYCSTCFHTSAVPNLIFYTVPLNNRNTMLITALTGAYLESVLLLSGSCDRSISDNMKISNNRVVIQLISSPLLLLHAAYAQHIAIWSPLTYSP